MSIEQRISDGLALAGAVLAFVLAAYLLIVGPELIMVTPGGPTTTIHSPTLAGLVPLGIGVVALWAVGTHLLRAHWMAAALAIVAALLVLFSIVLQLAGIPVLLLLAAVARTTPRVAVAGPD